MMLKKTALVGASLLCLAHYARAQNFDQLIAFGDSTTDTGWFANGTSTGAGGVKPFFVDAIIKDAVRAGGNAHFTGPGPGNAQILGSFFGLSANPANTTGGTNYAIGGAFDDAHLGPGYENLFSTTYMQANTKLPGTAEQISNYLASVNGHANPDALYLISSGGNDAFYAAAAFPNDASAANAFLLPEAQALATAVAKLQQAGARYIIVSNEYQPPSATENGSQAGKYGQTISDATFADLAAAGVKFIFADTAAVVVAVEQNPLAFGITAPISSNACIFQGAAKTVGTGVVCAPTTTPPPATTAYGYLASADATMTHLFVDGTHLAEAGQIIIADFYNSLLTQSWDGTTTKGDGPVNNGNLTANGGNGTWNNSSANTNWATSIGTINASWNGISATFGGAPGTVTVADPISYQSMQFTTGGYLLTASAGGTLMPSGVGPIFVAGDLTPTGDLTATIAAPITGSGGVDKDGFGTLTLSGANTYTGPTTIDAGAINLTGSLVSPVTVNASGTLRGSGTVTGAVTVNDMATLEPGTPTTPGAPGAPGTLNVGPLTLESGSLLSYLLGTPNLPGGTTNDLTNVTGALTVNGDTLFVTDPTFTIFSPGTYRLIDYSGALNGSGQIVVGTLPDGATGVINTATSGQVNLIVSESPTTQFWDGTNTGADGTVHGGDGIWNNTATNWTSATGLTNQAWQGISAIFAGAPGTVTVADPITYQSMQFSTPGHLLTASAGGTLMPSGVAPIIVDGDLTATIAAPITGSGGMDKNGLGTLTLTGDDTYSGGTTISFGTLQLGNGGTTGSIVGDVTNHGTLMFNRSDTVSFGGAISGDGELMQLGPGTLVLTGNSTFTGPTNIEGGALQVNGSIAGSSLTTANTGTMLFGTGTVGNTQVDTGATLAPGNGTPGTVTTINGNLALAPGAAYLVSVSPTTSSRANVTGAVTLNGVVETILTPGSYSAKTAYDILDPSAISGQFIDFDAMNAPGFGGTFSYTSTNVFLNLTASLGGDGGLGQNQQNVATAINAAFNAGATLPAGFFPLFTLSDGSLNDALAQVDGEVSTGAERAALQLTDQFLDVMLDPFVNGRGNVAGFPGAGALGFAPDGLETLPANVRSAYASLVPMAPSNPGADRRWSVWGSAYGGSTTASGDAAAGSTNSTAGTYGFAAGVDDRVRPGTVVGFALAGGGTTWGLANGPGSGSSDALQVGAFGTSWFGPAYLGGALAFSNHWFTTSRTALGEPLTANFAGQSYAARLEGGYRVRVSPTFGMTPYGAVQFQDFHTTGYSESDATGAGFGLAYNSMNATDVRTELGSRFAATTLLYGKPLILSGRVAWAHDTVSTPAMSAAFETLPGASFTVFGAPIPHDSALTTVGAQLFLSANWSLTVKFDGAFAPRSQTFGGIGTLRYTW